MTDRSRPLILALVAAIILFIALSKETWVAIPIVAGVGVVLVARARHLDRASTVAALIAIASISCIAFGLVITLLATFAREMAGLVSASGLTAIAVGVVGLILSVRYLRRAMRPSAPAADTASEPVASR